MPFIRLKETREAYEKVITSKLNDGEKIEVVSFLLQDCGIDNITVFQLIEIIKKLKNHEQKG